MLSVYQAQGTLLGARDVTLSKLDMVTTPACDIDTTLSITIGQVLQKEKHRGRGELITKNPLQLGDRSRKASMGSVYQQALRSATSERKLNITEASMRLKWISHLKEAWRQVVQR